MGSTIELPKTPSSIVSLVPSQTELLFDLGLKSEVKGITKFCIHPADEVRDVKKIGGTKNFNFSKIDELNPDLVIGNKEENYKEGIEQLREKYPVWMSDIYTLNDSLDMINSVASLVGRAEKGKEIIEDIKSGFESIKKKAPLKVLYFIWQKPYMVAGGGTFIDIMLSQIGLDNVAPKDRYPELSPDDIRAINPDLILLSSEPYPFKAKHFSDFSALCPNAKIHIVDGEMFSWYGSRLRKAPAYFNSLSF
ncbi:cobalamin-binding protein [Fulvivirga sp. RKSG066]|nr:cobalamin-binding protein [Fulvivirga aurantia]